MAEIPATSADLQARSFRPLDAGAIAVGGTLLDDAWAIMLSANSSVAGRLDKVPGDPVFRSLVVQTLCAMVLRVISNPEGKLEERQDDYQYRLDAAVSSGALYISDAELARLAEGDSVSDGAWTIRARAVPAAEWCPIPEEWIVP